VTRTAFALPVLSSKVSVPGARQAIVSPETLGRFAWGGSRRLLLVLAPAGYGKTTVTAVAARDLGWQTAWYTLDFLDRDPSTFVAGVVETVGRVVPGFGDTVRRRIADATHVPLNERELLALLLSAFEHEVDGALHLVFDDYHEGANEALTGIVDYLIAALPPNVHVVILSRYGSGLHTSRLLLADQVVQIGIEDLRFTEEQAAHFLSHIAGHALTGRDLDRVIEESEGWPAGLALASRALADRGAHDHTGLADPRLKGDLFTYLAEQVYSREAPAVRAFLKSSCCLERISPQLADRVTGSAGSSRHLDHLALNSVFTFREHGGAYRYHRLFREYLRHKVTQEDGTEAYRAAQLVAARASEQTGDLPGAVDLYLAAGDTGAAAAVLGRGGGLLLDRCLPETLREWTARLPVADPALKPWRLLLQAQIMAREARHPEALRQLEAAASLVPADGGALAFCIASAVERTLFWRGEYAAAAGACDRALAVAGSDRERVHALVSLGAALTATSDWHAADAALNKAEALAGAADGEELLRLESQRIAGLTVQGRFREAAARCRDIRDPVEQTMPPSFAMSFLNLAALSSLYLADYQGALDALGGAAQIAERFGYRFFEPLLWDARGQIDLARGDLASGLELAGRAAAHPSLAEDPGCRALAIGHAATGHRRFGDLDSAMALYQSAVRLVADTRLRQPRLTCLANREYVACLMDGRRSLSDLGALRREAERGDLPFVAAKCAVFRALVLDGRGNREEALWMLRLIAPTALHHGQLHFASQELATRPDLTLDLLASTTDPVVLGQLLRAVALHPRAVALLAAALTRGDSLALEALRAGAALLPAGERATLLQRGRRQRSPSVRRLAAELGALTTDAADRPGIPELTPRETQILALLAEGRRNGEIAELLVLSPATVKTYVNRVFSKLGVTDRVQAALYYRRHTDGRDP
jgi:LuxR family transcriptional regulator, maltose regulon positive regulatory protein